MISYNPSKLLIQMLIQMFKLSVDIFYSIVITRYFFIIYSSNK